MNRLRLEKKVAVISALVEGNSIRSTERMTGVHRDTIMRLLLATGHRCQSILDERMRGLRVRRLEFDEIWTYVGKKQKQISVDDPVEFGDQYVFVALDPDTKMIPSFAVGKRDPITTWNLVRDVRERVLGKVQVTTDGFRPYIRAIDDAFGADVDYAMLIKSYGSSDEGPGAYYPAKVVGIFHQVLFGDPDPKRICTSYVERQNLTIRMQLRRFTRLTNAFSRKLVNLKAALSLHFAWYNFCRVHSSLRVTPAMAAGISNEIWPLERLFG